MPGPWELLRGALREAGDELERLRESTREAAGDYRKLAALHQTEVQAASAQLQASSAETTAALARALEAAAVGWDAQIEEHHQALDAALHLHLVSTFGVADSARPAQVLARLQAGRGERAPLALVVLAWDELVGMVAFRERLYVSTGMLAALPDDAALAFILAHEIAHIDLGHIRLDAALRGRLPPLPPMLSVRTVLGLASRAWMRPDMERDADREGLRLARQVGYRADAFEDAFAVLAADAADRGLDLLVERDLPGWSEFWMQKLTGYPSLHERRDHLRALL